MRHWCSFCGREERECALLVLGHEDTNRTPGICGDCLRLCAGAAADHARGNRPGPVFLDHFRRRGQERYAAAMYRVGDDPGDAA